MHQNFYSDFLYFKFIIIFHLSMQESVQRKLTFLNNLLAKILQEKLLNPSEIVLENLINQTSLENVVKIIRMTNQQKIISQLISSKCQKPKASSFVRLVNAESLYRINMLKKSIGYYYNSEGNKSIISNLEQLRKLKTVQPQKVIFQTSAMEENIAKLKIQNSELTSKFKRNQKQLEEVKKELQRRQKALKQLKQQKQLLKKKLNHNKQQMMKSQKDNFFNDLTIEAQNYQLKRQDHSSFQQNMFQIDLQIIMKSLYYQHQEGNHQNFYQKKHETIYQKAKIGHYRSFQNGDQTLKAKLVNTKEREQITNKFDKCKSQIDSLIHQVEICRKNQIEYIKNSNKKEIIEQEREIWIDEVGILRKPHREEKGKPQI